MVPPLVYNLCFKNKFEDGKICKDLFSERDCSPLPESPITNPALIIRFFLSSTRSYWTLIQLFCSFSGGASSQGSQSQCPQHHEPKSSNHRVGGGGEGQGTSGDEGGHLDLSGESHHSSQGGGLGGTHQQSELLQYQDKHRKGIFFKSKTFKI